MKPYDLAIFARILVGECFNGELDSVSAPFRGVAVNLNGLPPGSRLVAWECFLAGRDDRDEIVMAVADVDPSGPAPEPGEDAPEEDAWPPLRLGELPPVMAFPVGVLPAPAARLVEEASGAVGCDPGMVAGPVLAVAGGLIGRSASLLKGSNWFTSACLLQATVAFPGDGKSPCFWYATAPVREIDRRLASEFDREKEEYRRQCEADRKAKAKPRPPAPRRVVLEDATMEACFRVLAANPRGLVMCLDELSTLILGLNQYKGGKGNDRANLMKMWAGASVLIDRVLNEFGEPIRIPHPHLCITGNLTPATLAEMVNRRGEDGLIDRWLFVYPDRRPKLKSRHRRPVSKEAVEGWVDVACALWERPMDEHEGRPCPHVVYFSNPGKAEFDRLHDAHVDEVNDGDFPDALRGPWSKLEEYAGRLCLILVLLRHAADPTADRDVLPLVGPAVARDAWSVVDYFKSHHRRVKASLEGRGLGGAPEGARLILRWIQNHPGRASFTGRDLALSYPPSRGYDRAMMEDGLSWLEQRKAIRRHPEAGRPKETPGRKPAPAWDVHPELSGAQRNQRFQQNRRHIVESVDSVAHPGGESPGPEEEVTEEGGDDDTSAS